MKPTTYYLLQEHQNNNIKYLTYPRWRSSAVPRHTTRRRPSRTWWRRIGRPTCRRLCTAARWTGPTARASRVWPPDWLRTRWAVRSWRHRCRRTWATRPDSSNPPSSPRPATAPSTDGRIAAGAGAWQYQSWRQQQLYPRWWVSKCGKTVSWQILLIRRRWRNRRNPWK